MTQGTYSKLFADDFKLYGSQPALLQSSIDNAVAWSRRWRILFNQQKLEHLHVSTLKDRSATDFALEGKVIRRVDHVKDLGIITSDKLNNYDKHVSHIVLKATKRAGAILRSFRHLFNTTLTNLFLSLVRPILEYNSQLWNPSKKQNVAIIESVQRSFTKKLNGLKGLSYDERCKTLGLVTLERRRLNQDLTLVYSMIHGYFDLDYRLFLHSTQRQQEPPQGLVTHSR